MDYVVYCVWCSPSKLIGHFLFMCWIVLKLGISLNNLFWCILLEMALQQIWQGWQSDQAAIHIQCCVHSWLPPISQWALCTSANGCWIKSLWRQVLNFCILQLFVFITSSLQSEIFFFFLNGNRSCFWSLRQFFSIRPFIFSSHVYLLSERSRSSVCQFGWTPNNYAVSGFDTK